MFYVYYYESEFKSPLFRNIVTVVPVDLPGSTCLPSIVQLYIDTAHDTCQAHSTEDMYGEQDYPYMPQVTNVRSRSSAEAHTLRQRANAQVQANGARQHTQNSVQPASTAQHCTVHVGNSEES